MQIQPKILFYVWAWCTVVFSSCNKDDAPVEPVATFKFIINGTAVEWNGRGGGTDVCVLCGPNISNRQSFFELIATPPQSAFEGIILTIKATALNVGTYSDTITTAIIDYQQAPNERAPHRIGYSQVIAASTQVGDFATVTFTSIKDGIYHDGTFKAKLTSSPYGPDAAKVEIEGEFHNLKAY